MSLSLNEAAKLALDNGDTKLAGIMAQWAEESDVQRMMRFMGISGNSVTWNLEGELPDVGFRGVGEDWQDSEGVFNPQKESLAILGGEIKVDRFLVKTMGEEAAVTDQVTLKTKSLSQTFTQSLLYGSTLTDPASIDGLQTRITETSQLLANGATANGDALSLVNLDTAIDAVANPNAIIMSRAMKRKFSAAYRDGTFPNLMLQPDDTGRHVLHYNDLPILTGYGPGKNTPILPFTEANPGGGTATGTSIYVVNFGDDGLMGISNGGIMYQEIRENSDHPIQTVRLEWYVGILRKSEFAASRLWGIKDAAIVH